MTRRAPAPKVLVTGFGPFPGAPENPTDPLVRALGAEPPEQRGVGTLRAVILPVDYRKSWPVLRRICGSFAPDVIVHFGLSRMAEDLVVERRGCRRIRGDRPDAAGFAPPSGFARRTGPESLPASLPAEPLVAALRDAGFPADISDEAGGYVCDATFYRSLHAAGAAPDRLVGFIHIPPEDTRGLTRERLRQAAGVAVRTAASLWSKAAAPSVPH